ncbi:helix-turn-helix domain-containing protein [Streptosporangium sp. NPDC004631]
MSGQSTSNASVEWREFGRALRARREQRDLSLRDLAEQVCWHFSVIGKWEQGKNRPSFEAVMALDAKLGAEGELVSLALRASMADTDRTRRGTVDGKTSRQDEDDEMERRVALQFLAALGAGTIVPVNVVDTILSGVNRAAGEGDDFCLDDWEEVVWEYSYQLNTGPFGSLIRDVSADLVDIGRLLDAGPSEFVRVGLFRISAQLSFLLAEDLANVGARSAARRCYRAAHRSADASGDRDLRVWMRAKEAQRGFWQGRPEEVVLRLADDAVRLAGDIPSSGTAAAYKAQAFALAAQGDADGARGALRRVGDVFERLSTNVTNDPHLMWGFPETDLVFGTAYVSSLIGDRRESQRAVDHALALYPHERVYGIANLRLIEIMNAVRHRDDVSGALDYAVSTGQNIPVTAARRRITGQIVEALPQETRALPAARKLRFLTANLRSS